MEEGGEKLFPTGNKGSMLEVTNRRVSQAAFG